MNKQFMLKMMQAKQLQYQALKEIMPVQMVNRITRLENELLEFGKEYVMNYMSAPKEENQTTDTDSKPKTRKVTIE